MTSRIVEAALGVGRKPSTDRDPKRPRERVDEPCHAIVIESLRDYRPDELQTRRENRALMDWSSGKIRKCLEDACQLYGLYLREVRPGYTSRQCSRTGLPGIRCSDVPGEQFRSALVWRRAVSSARKRIAQNKGTEEDKFWFELEEKYGRGSNSTNSGTILRLPRRGGELFVAAPTLRQLNELDRGDPQCKLAKRALHADLNAAANIGLRALLDPDFPATWWSVPCNVKDGKAAQDRVKGSFCFEGSEIQFLNDPGRSGGRRDVVNAWRDPSAGPLASGIRWQNTPAYWNGVQGRAIRVLRHANELASSTLEAGF